MPEAIAPQTPAPEFKPQPTVDEVHARVQADLAQQSAPQTAPEATGAPVPPEAAPAPKVEPPKAPSDLEKLQRQHARQQREWQAANQLMQQKYEAQLKDLQAKLEALGKPQSPSQPEAKPDPVNEKLERVIRELEAQKAAQAEAARKQAEQAEAAKYYQAWESRAKEALGNKDMSGAFTEFCELEGIDPIQELIRYTNGYTEQRGYPIDAEHAVEDLNQAALRKLERYRTKFGSNASPTPQASPTNQTMPGTGGLPAPGTQGAPVTTQDRLDALVDHYSKSGFFKDQPF